MSRIGVVFLLVYGFVLGGLATLDRKTLALAIPFILYIAVGLWDAHDNPALQVERSELPKRVTSLTPIHVKITIRNIGKLNYEVGLVDLIPEGLDIIEGEACILLLLKPGQSIEMSYVVQGKRGIYRFEGIQAILHGSFGLFERKVVFPAKDQVFILPEIPKLRRLLIKPRQTRVYSGNIPSRTGGMGTDFFGVRNYQSGDPFRYINWRVSARYPDSLFSNEFEHERVSTVWLILDARLRNNPISEESGLFEHVIMAGTGLAQLLLNEGNRVGLLVYGGYLQWTFPGYGKIQKERILLSLAQAQPGDLFVFSGLENLPTRAFPTSAQLILISSLDIDDLDVLIHLRGRGYQIILISPNPIKFEERGLKEEEGGSLALRIARIERYLQLNKIRDAGIQVVDWDVTIPIDQAIQAQLQHFSPAFNILGVKK
jgi:uncharacterized protein (DUF58 family)